MVRVCMAIFCMAAVYPAGAGCGGEDAVCGPGEAPAAAVTAAISDVVITYGAFTSSPNNDCPPAEGGPTSLTIEGTQTGLLPGERFSLVLCLPRPDELGDAPVSLGDDRLVQLIDVNARLADECRLRLDYMTPPSGTITFSGYCDGGSDARGYALTFDGSAAGVRICPDGAGGFTEEPVTVTLSGSAAVEAIIF
jgi:hypothetical protein